MSLTVRIGEEQRKKLERLLTKLLIEQDRKVSLQEALSRLQEVVYVGEHGEEGQRDQVGPAQAAGPKAAQQERDGGVGEDEFRPVPRIGRT